MVKLLIKMTKTFGKECLIRRDYPRHCGQNIKKGASNPLVTTLNFFKIHFTVSECHITCTL